MFFDKSLNGVMYFLSVFLILVVFVVVFVVIFVMMVNFLVVNWLLGSLDFLWSLYFLWGILLYSRGFFDLFFCFGLLDLGLDDNLID